MSLNKIQWDIDVVAKSSIVHRDSFAAVGTNTSAPFRTEKVIGDDGAPQEVPIVSGSSFRGILRRIGEELTAAVLDYEDVALPIPAAHLLTNGGRLGKSKSPFTDEDERHLKALLPLIAVFGGSASGRIMEGLLYVGKVVPEVAEAAPMLHRPPKVELPETISLLSDETFSHLSDHRPRAGQAPHSDSDEKTSPLGRFSVETLPAGTRLQTWVLINNATSIQVAFLRDVLTAFASRGHLGGRIASGHGVVTASFTPDVQRGQLPDESVDWQSELRAHRDEAIDALSKVT